MNKYKLKSVLNKHIEPITYRIDGKPHYDVSLSITSDEGGMDNVIWVKYKLHKDFKQREKLGTDKNRDFGISIRTWGTFPIEVTVGLKDDKIYKFTHDFGKDIIK